MIKKILVPQDGSSNSGIAADYAVWLSGRFGAELIGLHVVDIVSLEGPFFHDISGSLGFEPFLNFSAKMREALEAKGKTVLADFDEACSKKGAPHETLLASGIVASEICERANLADLVVIGKRGVNEQFEYGLLGSVTESVLRRSPRPVLIVPSHFREPKNPLLAYDGSPNASKAMHSAAEWVRTLNLPLTVVTASSRLEDDGLLKEAEDYLKPYGIRARFKHLKDDPPVAIENFYKENGHDLLFMGTSHHSRLVEMVIGSTTEHVMRNVDGPFFLER